jgi:hypothetical protein
MASSGMLPMIAYAGVQAAVALSRAPGTKSQWLTAVANRGPRYRSEPNLETKETLANHPEPGLQRGFRFARWEGFEPPAA